MIGLDLYTVHSNPQGLCNDTAGVYWQSKAGYGAGLLKNSECSIGGWAGYNWQANVLQVHGHGVSVGLLVGAIAGYRTAPVLPMLVPSIKVGRFRFSYLPRSPGAQSDGLHISIEFAPDPPAEAGFFSSIKE